MLSVHTSPLHQPGTGDAGGMNVYIIELARRLAELSVEVDIYTRRTGHDQPPEVEAVPGVRVRHVAAGPLGGLRKEHLPTVLGEFATGVRQAVARYGPAGYDVVHSHYWLSGQVGRMLSETWGVPLVHTMHTMAKVKNASLAVGDSPEPLARLAGESALVDSADRLVANTAAEAAELVHHYRALPERIDVVHPGVDLDVFCPGDGRAAARRRLGLGPEALVVLFAGRIQPLKAPDMLLRAVAELVLLRPELRERLVVPVIGGLSGSGADYPARCRQLAAGLGISDLVRFQPPVGQRELADWYRAATVLAMPSHSESFGLVALEAQACGTPVLAANVGGLSVAVDDGITGRLVRGHDPADYARVLAELADRPGLTEQLGVAAIRHAERFGWESCAGATARVYSRAWHARRVERLLAEAV
ncbi:D-inositol-3-phosphate glycosyltransferase [Saccharothrix sp. ST-888]|uniref:D-inositol-3-phosphate glycosyltransferase n=1 Tax=Saccharothrix sp. ST-888 TaxID=1427391 RepID=UPI0018CF8FFD|nr:D-inositol-3-phosphate glycosyltransferase [Saccharothrix sp. ST-888]